jgi:hypothetical protein
MKAYVVCLLASVVIFSSCEKKAQIVTVTETRTASARNLEPKLFATSDQRFRDAKPSPVKGETPVGWRELPASQFRLLNYRFGESGMGEVWVSLSAGSVLDNVNRWLQQFAVSPLTADGLKNLQSMEIVKTSGTYVTAEGDYVGGMGAAPKPGFALAGVITALSDGRILTAKMVGPKAEVESAKPVFETYVKSLSLAE